MICVQKVVSVLVTIGKNYLVDIKEKISLKLHLIRSVTDVPISVKLLENMLNAIKKYKVMLMVCVCGHKKDKHESAGSRKELLFGFRTLCREVDCICESYKQKYLITKKLQFL